jgi:hypothetical protein
VIYRRAALGLLPNDYESKEINVQTGASNLFTLRALEHYETNLCVRYDLSPMGRVAHRHFFLGTSIQPSTAFRSVARLPVLSYLFATGGFSFGREGTILKPKRIYLHGHGPEVRF